MTPRSLPHIQSSLLAVVLAVCSGHVCAAEPATVYVVRHADKELTTLNELISTALAPELAELTIPLNANGMQRALDLHDQLRFEGVELAAVFSTPTLRTWQTAAPSLDLIHSEHPQVSVYTALDELADEIGSEYAGKTVLVVGHSGSVEAIVTRLTGDSVERIGNEYNNLFVVTTDGEEGEFERRTYGAFAKAGSLSFLETAADAAGASIEIEEAEDLSGVACMKDGSLLVVSDESKAHVQVMKKGADGYVAQSPLRIVNDGDVKDELDLEAVAREADSQTYYAVGSFSSRRKQIYKKHANKSKAERRQRFEQDSPDRQTSREQLFRFEIDDDGKLRNLEAAKLRKAISRHDTLKHFFHKKIDGRKNVAIPSKENGIDIEGLAADGGKLYLGFRGPVLRWNFVPVMVVDFEEPERAEVTYVQLDGRGIRDLVRVDDGFLILAGANGEERLSYQLYFWNGLDCFPGKADQRSPNMRLLGTLPAAAGIKPEGITVLNGVDRDATHYDLLVIHDGVQGGEPAKYRVPKVSRK